MPFLPVYEVNCSPLRERRREEEAHMRLGEGARGVVQNTDTWVR